MTSVQDVFVRVEPLVGLSRFRLEFYDAMTARADGLFELAEALLCKDGPVRALVELCLVPEHRRGHGGLYDAVNAGGLDIVRLRRAITAAGIPRAGDGRIVLAVDVSNWLRPDANTSPDRLFCHVHGRGRSADQLIPGWPYSFVAALETGRTSWTRVLDALRLGPADDATLVTARQLREVVGRIVGAGAWKQGETFILIVADAGYDLARLAFELMDLPVAVVGRVRSDRVYYAAAPERPLGRSGPQAKHGAPFALAGPDRLPQPVHVSTGQSLRYGAVSARCWDRLHPRLTHRTSWIGYDGELPILEGTVLCLVVEHLRGERDPKPMWLWASVTGADAALADVLWQSYLRRFDIEHTFRFFKQTLGWDRPRLRTPHSADRWTWLVIAAYTQLNLARELVEDLRLPWERPATPGRLTPARVRRGFRNIRGQLPVPASVPKPSRPGPGRPKGSRNRAIAARPAVGKTEKRSTTTTEHRDRTISRG